MADETTIIVNIKIPSDASALIRAIRRAIGFFKSIVEKPVTIVKK